MTLQCGQWGSLWPGYPPPGSRLPTPLCVCVLESLEKEPSGGPPLLPKFKLSSGPCCLLFVSPPAPIPSYCNRTRLAPSIPDLNPPVGSRRVHFLCVHSTCHSIWCLVVLNESTWKGNGGQREEQVEKLNESLINKRKQLQSFCALPAEAAFPTEPSYASTNEWSSDFKVPVVSFRGTLANANSVPPFFFFLFCICKTNPSFLLSFLSSTPSSFFCSFLPRLFHIYPIFQGKKWLFSLNRSLHLSLWEIELSYVGTHSLILSPIFHRKEGKCHEPQCIFRDRATKCQA